MQKIIDALNAENPKRKDNQISTLSVKEFEDLWLKVCAIATLSDIDLTSLNHTLCCKHVDGEDPHYRFYFVLLKPNNKHIEINSNLTIRKRTIDAKIKFHFFFDENLEIV